MSFQSLILNQRDARSMRLKRFLVLLVVLSLALVLTSCGGGSSTTSTSPSQVKNRAFITNTYSGNLQIMDSQNDTSPLTAETTSSTGQLIPGQPVTIPAGNSATWLLENPSLSTTVVYDPTVHSVIFIDNVSQTLTNRVALPAAASMSLFSPDGTILYAAVHNAPITGNRPGGVTFVNVASAAVQVTSSVPSTSAIALSPSGQYLLAFADNSDSVM